MAARIQGSATAVAVSPGRSRSLTHAVGGNWVPEVETSTVTLRRPRPAGPRHTTLGSVCAPETEKLLVSPLRRLMPTCAKISHWPTACTESSLSYAFKLCMSTCARPRTHRRLRVWRGSGAAQHRPTAWPPGQPPPSPQLSAAALSRGAALPGSGGLVGSGSVLCGGWWLWPGRPGGVAEGECKRWQTVEIRYYGSAPRRPLVDHPSTTRRPPVDHGLWSTGGRRVVDGWSTSGRRGVRCRSTVVRQLAIACACFQQVPLTADRATTTTPTRPDRTRHRGPRRQSGGAELW